MFCLYTLPLARPAQAKIQMLTTSRNPFKIPFKILRTLTPICNYQMEKIKEDCKGCLFVYIENMSCLKIPNIGILEIKIS